MNKKVSVIVNCHNGGKYLRKCILSILNQKYENFEIIFYNNFSNDR
jgi:glycosyltransferase involved in cell wall biosynthesis